MSNYKNDPMKQLVYKHDVIVALNEKIDEPIGFVGALKDVPVVDAVEVVRCKECKYWKPYTSQYGSGQFCECPCSFGGQGIKKPDDYCSYGERRDDKEYNNSILNARKGEE